MRGNLGAIQFSQYTQVREKYVAALAHSLWLVRGCPEGSPEIDWFSAESEFDQQFLAQIELGIPA